MKRFGLIALLLLASACSNEWGLLIDIAADAEVTDLDAVRVRVDHPSATSEQVHVLNGKSFPQTVTVVSKELTGPVAVVVEGLQNNRIRATARTSAELVKGQRVKVAVTLARYCPSGSCCTPKAACEAGDCGDVDDGCGGTLQCGGCTSGACVEGRCQCAAKTCEMGMCGMLPDGCGGSLGCGECAEGETCGAGGPNRCAVGSCTPLTTCSPNENCGNRSDGCSNIITCGPMCANGQECGGGADGGTPNVCGCTPRASCPAGTCGTVPDGCGGTLPCSSCPNQGVCQLDGGAGTCCTPLTQCPAGTCGSVPDGCGGSITCSACPGTQRCVLAGASGTCCTPATACGAGQNCDSVSDGCGGTVACGVCPGGQQCGVNAPPNVCGCAPNCATAACGAPDGCGGTCKTGTCAGEYDHCSNGVCCGILTEYCGGACIYTSSDNANCGKCGNVCTGGSECQAAHCTCRTMAENADGHCCPPGWTFTMDHSSQRLMCFKGPLTAATHAQALAQCKAETATVFDGGISALGAGRSTLTRLAFPAGACASSFLNALDPNAVAVASTPTTETSRACVGGGGSCANCGDCSALGAASCSQPFYCAMEARGSTSNVCNAGDDSVCPPGVMCFAFMSPSGSCLGFGYEAPCMVNSDCPPLPDAGPGVCLSRQGPTLSGYCQLY